MTKKIGYQGEAGANSHIACNLYDNNSSSIALKTFDEVFISLEKNEIDLAMIPIENTIAGSCLLYTSPSPRDRQKSRMPSSA